ncbi:hypothetical protein M2271_000439 [Streptomyces sp. LBL]|nr:hypothetical protein [Streptomyces sp. LBL]
MSTTEAPTGKMIIDTTVSFPEQSSVRAAVDGASAHAFYVDARRLAEDLFGDDQYANILLLGAYKDEYEVARLHLDEDLETEIEAQFGEGSRFAFQLHPPVLRALGMKRKISLGPRSRPALRVLRSMRKVRGTRLDIFGYAGVRRVERALVEEYRDAVLRALDTEGFHSGPDTVVELAALPDMVRGYEHIKLANVAAYRARQAELLAQLERPVVAAGR